MNHELGSLNHQYFELLEQQQFVQAELDDHGNVWLALGVIDVSPDQATQSGFRSQVINFRTGKVFSLIEAVVPTDLPSLTVREIEVLSLIRDGRLGKEISQQLSISVHTVNTHRQRILEKPKAGNSLEAVRYASGLGLLQ